MNIGLIKLNISIPEIDIYSNIPPLGLSYLAAFLEKEGFASKILDYNSASQVARKSFLSSNFDILCFSVTSFEFNHSLDIAKTVKRNKKNIITIFGGPHVNIVDKSLLLHSDIDYAIFGEGEYTILEIINLLRNQRKPTTEELEKISGLIFRDNNGNIIQNKRREFIYDLDSLPFPAHHLLINDLSKYYLHPILTSRGCPFECCFCTNQIFDNVWRKRSPENIVNEIEWAIKNYNKKRFLFCDENFTLDVMRVDALCDLLLSRDVKIKWVSWGVRADAITLKLMKKMKASGCYAITVGVESVDPEVLKNIGKGETIEILERGINYAKEAGIEDINLHFMIGNPTDTLKKVKRSVHFVESLDLLKNAYFYLALPYPKTKLWDYIEQHGKWVDKDYCEYNHFSKKPVFETPSFTYRQRLKALQYIDQRRKIYKYKKLLYRKLKKIINIISNPLGFIRVNLKVINYYIRAKNSLRDNLLEKIAFTVNRQEEAEKFFSGLFIGTFLDLNIFLNRIRKPIKPYKNSVLDSKKILVISLYEIIYPPYNGGDVRLYQLYKNLSKFYKLSIINFSGGTKLKEEYFSENIRKFSVPRSRIFNLLARFYYDFWREDGPQAMFFSLQALLGTKYRRIVKKLIRISKIIIMDKAYLSLIVNPDKSKGQILIYNPHNVDYLYHKATMRAPRLLRWFISSYMRYLEKTACQKSDIIFACSQQDKITYHKLYKIPLEKIRLAPNGADIKTIPLVSEPEKEIAKTTLGINENKKVLLFLGSSYILNLQAVEFIVFKLAPLLKSYIFLIAGGVLDAFMKKYKNIEDIELVEPQLLNLVSDITLGPGWYPDFCAQDGSVGRWTQNNFIFYIKNAGEGTIYFNASCPIECKGEIIINDKKNVEFYVSNKWKKIEFFVSENVSNSSYYKIDIRLTKLWRRKISIRPRELGLLVRKIGYQTIYNGVSYCNMDTYPIYKYKKDNCLFLGTISEEFKNLIFRAADLAVNPMFDGYGTHLKIPEYMAAGIPVITTMIGTRGIEEAIEKECLLISEPNEFKYHIERLCNDRELYERIRINARKLVEEKYDWYNIAQNMIKVIEDRLNNKK